MSRLARRIPCASAAARGNSTSNGSRLVPVGDRHLATLTRLASTMRHGRPHPVQERPRLVRRPGRPAVSDPATAVSWVCNCFVMVARLAAQAGSPPRTRPGLEHRLRAGRSGNQRVQVLAGLDAAIDRLRDQTRQFRPEPAERGVRSSTTVFRLSCGIALTSALWPPTRVDVGRHRGAVGGDHVTVFGSGPFPVRGTSAMYCSPTADTLCTCGRDQRDGAAGFSDSTAATPVWSDARP